MDTWLLKLIGHGEDRLFFQGEYNPNATFEDSCTSSKARFDYAHAIAVACERYHTCSADYDWADTAVRFARKARRKSGISRIRARVMMIQCTDDSMVEPGGQDDFIKKLEAVGGKPIFLRTECRHEVFHAGNDVQGPYWNEVTKFLCGV